MLTFLVGEREIVSRRIQATEQPIAELQLARRTSSEHAAHQLILRHLAGELNLPRLHIAKLQRLFHHAKEHQYLRVLAVVQRVDQVASLTVRPPT